MAARLPNLNCTILLLRPFSIWGRHIEFSISTFSGLVLLLYLLSFSFMYFLITSVHLSFGLAIFRCPSTSIFPLLHLLQSFSPHGLAISVSLLLFSHLCLPYLPLLLFLHSWSSQSSIICPVVHLNIFISVLPKVSKFCSTFLRASDLNTLEQVWWRSYIVALSIVPNWHLLVAHYSWHFSPLSPFSSHSMSHFIFTATVLTDRWA